MRHAGRADLAGGADGQDQISLTDLGADDWEADAAPARVGAGSRADIFFTS
ncbi:MAG: hypothetical protein ABJC74_01140 [Gemmatimonadota bacterium]